MYRLRMVPALLLLVAGLGACDTGILDVLPQDEIAADIAIVDAETAQAALMGVYDAIQDTDLYGGDYLMWTDLLSDDVEHTGTFGSYGQADLINVPADNVVVEAMWTVSYDGVLRANTVIEKVPEVDGIPQSTVDEIVGEAYGLRALLYFGLVRTYGGVVITLEPAENLADIEELAQAARASEAEVWTQIEADIGEARSRLAAAGMDNSERRFVTPGFLDALAAKVHLYQEDWAAAEASARALVDSPDYVLAGSYDALFGDVAPAGPSEDIFRVEYLSIDANNYGFYYQYAGRFEVGATQAMYDAYDQANDERWAYSFDGTRNDGIQVVKYATTAGVEDIHVIRYAEVLLILAEALAQQNELAEAVTYLNMVHTRAGLTALDLATDLNDSQVDVLDAIYLERRLELAFEGERWFDLVRTGRASSVLGAAFSDHEALLPIPQSELDVSPNLVQNPGY